MQNNDIKDSYNCWTVLSKELISKNWRTYLLCKCQCGTIKEVNFYQLKNNASKRCSKCARRKERQSIDLSQIKDSYNKWTVIDKTIIRKGRHRYLLCRCECSNEKQVCYENLYSNKSTQCRSCALSSISKVNAPGFRKPWKKHKYKGLTWDKRDQKWFVQIIFEGHRYYVGRFEDEIDAAKAYDAMARKLLGAGTYLNFPEDNDE